MPIVPTQSTQYPPTSAVSLSAYARAIQVCECSFWGVMYQNCEPRDCNSIWTKNMRDYVQYYLAESQYEIERVLNYHVGYQWDAAERHQVESPIITDWAYIVSPGTRAESVVGSSIAINYATDPAVVGPIATTVTDVRELKLFHRNTDIEIDPSSVTLAGGLATFYIPKCRLIAPAYYDNPSNGWQYSDNSHFATSVDVKRIYNDTTTQGKIVSANCSCAETKTDACIHIRKADIGSVELGSASSCGCGQWIELNYLSGRELVDYRGYYTAWGRQAQDAIIRLAHVKMPHAPCACEAASNLWMRDRQVIVDGGGRALRGVCDFGPEEGAWTAWRFANAMSMVRGATL